ncbi:MAG TPA: alpha-glucan family phosphorylase, partial [Candidatus Cloacimonadota bacterium]|nr:alpha-glucan family phosphorylase [Candidatus Cloacimonadota bacterium]
DKDAYDLFSRIAPLIYKQSEHNPIKLLSIIKNERLEELAKDSGYLNQLDKVYQAYKEYLSFENNDFEINGKKWLQEHPSRIAYLCLEYGLHGSLPIYSGGLGILAGDYLKAASDQGIPLDAFGLLYKYGYFSQKVNRDGMQEEGYSITDWNLKPVKELKDNKNEPLVLEINVQGQKLYFKVWYINVGKIKLYLLDSDLPQNPPLFQSITHMLYEADKDKRILQEILLAYGSMALMDYLKINPTVFHMNEGHSAFIIFELLRRLMVEQNFSFAQAKNIIKARSVFTTHTPVVEGNEHFDKKLIDKYLKDKIDELGIGYDEIMAHGTIDGDNDNFWLPVLAIRFSKHINGVSELHSEVSRKMWHKIYPNLTDAEMPIKAITNGVHLQTWLSKQLTTIYDRYVGPEYLHTLERKHIWNNVLKIPDNEIWEAHTQRKEQMITFIRGRVQDFAKSKGNILSLVKKDQVLLHHKSLTFGFTRRFAQYKRATLLLKDPVRLLKILKNEERPVQFIFAGKAHPADIEGKKLIQQIIQFARENDVEDRFLFIEDYDMNVARHIVQGVDVWLNNPVKPMEASGTSGMKAGLNGVLNFSVLDGWWPECYDGKNGWIINAADFYNDYETAQFMEAQQIYDTIENEIAPLFYERDQANYPIRWIQRMKQSMYTVGMGFNMHRMLDEYTKKFYIPSIYLYEQISKNDYQALNDIIDIESKAKAVWDKIFIKDFFLKYPNRKKIISGDILSVEAYVYMDDADANMFEVELYHQYEGQERYELIPLDYTEKYKDNVVKYTCAFRLKDSGNLNLSVRVKPKYNLKLYKERNLVKWR